MLLLTYSELDTGIQNKMMNQSPSQPKRLEAINDVAKLLNTRYDISTSKREQSISVIADGSTAYVLSVLVSDDDVKKIDILKFPVATDSNEDQFDWVKEDVFRQHVADSVRINEFTTYTRDGIEYIMVNSRDNDESAVDLLMIYFSTFVAINGTTPQVLLTTNSGDKLLLPARYKNLVVFECLAELFPMSMGEAGRVDGDKYHNKYKAELKRLGLDVVGINIKKPKSKVKTRVSFYNS